MVSQRDPRVDEHAVKIPALEREVGELREEFQARMDKSDLATANGFQRLETLISQINAQRASWFREHWPIVAFFAMGATGLGAYIISDVKADLGMLAAVQQTMAAMVERTDTTQQHHRETLERHENVLHGLTETINQAIGREEGRQSK